MTPSLRIVCLAALAALPSACTTQTAYLSLQTAAKQQCLRQPLSDQAACRARLNKEDFESYTRQRGGD